jgi:transposase
LRDLSKYSKVILYQVHKPCRHKTSHACALARRWLGLHAQIITQNKELERLGTERAADLMTSHCIATLTVAEMLIAVGDDPTRIRSQAAFAKLCGLCPIPA